MDEVAFAELARKGAAEYPEVKLDPLLFIAQAKKHLPADAKLPEAIETLRAGELHLACACAQGSREALQIFERDFLDGPTLRRVFSRLHNTPVTADEARSALREKLLVAGKERPPRISGYSGRWPLAGWLRMTAARTVVDLLRRSGDPVASPDAQARIEELAASVSPELRHFKDQYREPFQRAINAAFESLDAESCNLLRLQIVQGLKTSQIASLFGVDRSTIKRRLADCRQQLLDETRRQLQGQLNLSTAEFESLAGLVQSQLHLSFDRLLRERD